MSDTIAIKLENYFKKITISSYTVHNFDSLIEIFPIVMLPNISEWSISGYSVGSIWLGLYAYSVHNRKNSYEYYT